MAGLPLIVILLWVGFLVCLGLLFSARMVRAAFIDRATKALTPTLEEDKDPAAEQRSAEMRQNLGARLLGPVLKRLGAKVGGKAKGKAGDQVKDMLEQAGHPMGMHYAEFMALKFFCLVLFFGIGFVTSIFAIPMVLPLFMPGPLDPTMRMMFSGLWVLVLSFVGFSGPAFWLRRFVNKRLKQIRKAMADIVDLIVLAIEAGLGFDQALDQAIQKTNGPLTDELRRVAYEVRNGRQQGDAFRAMALRVKMPELSLLVAAIDQAMKMGTGLAQALRLQATEIRERRMAFIREQAGKLPVKMMLPLVLFIFPALFVVILGPAAVQMAEMSRKGELGAFGG